MEQSVTYHIDRDRANLLPRTAIVAILLSILLILALHFLKPDYHPAWRFLSEYSIGEFGFVMQAAFIAMALASSAVAASLWRNSLTWTAKFGLVLHWVVALSLVGAAIFTGDPVTAEPSQLTSHGMMHAICGSIGIPGVPIAALAVVYGMTMPGTPDRTRLQIAAFAVVFCVVSMFVYITTLMSGGGKIGPADYVGWANRIMVAAFDWWWISAAAFAIRLNRGEAVAKIRGSRLSAAKVLPGRQPSH
jgi:Protein of unknown function (DUF998)